MEGSRHLPTRVVIRYSYVNYERMIARPAMGRSMLVALLVHFLLLRVVPYAKNLIGSPSL